MNVTSNVNPRDQNYKSCCIVWTWSYKTYLLHHNWYEGCWQLYLRVHHLLVHILHCRSYQGHNSEGCISTASNLYTSMLSTLPLQDMFDVENILSPSAPIRRKYPNGPTMVDLMPLHTVNALQTPPNYAETISSRKNRRQMLKLINHCPLKPNLK